MQVYALGTGSFLTGALSMFTFCLGTLPLMFAFGVFSSLLSSKFTGQMMKVTSILVLVLGLVMGNRGLLLAGINVSDAFLSVVGIKAEQDNKTANAVIKDGYQLVTTNLEPGSYQPVSVYAGIPLRWTIVAEEGKLNGCNNEIIIPAYGKQQKLEVGERFATIALSKHYHFNDLPDGGPEIRSVFFENEKVILSFSHATQLKTSDNQPIRELEIAGSDCLFKPVIGAIKGNKIIISSKEPDIKYVRYGWKPYSVGNLVNENGWPASTFQINCPYP